MDETSNLALELRARITPQIEGADQLLSNIQNLPSSIQLKMREAVESPAFQEGLTTQQIQKVESINLTQFEGIKQFQEQQQKFTEQLQTGFESPKITLRQEEKFNKRIEEQRQSLQSARAEVQRKLEGGEFEFLGPDKSQIFAGSLTEGIDEAIEKIKKFQGELRETVNRYNNVTEASREFSKSIVPIEIRGEVKSLVQSLTQMHEPITEKMQGVVQSAAFTENLTPQQKNTVENFASMNDMLEFEKFQAEQQKLAEKLNIDLQEGKLSKTKQQYYDRQFAAQKGKLENFQDKLLTELGENDFLNPDQKQMLRTAIGEGTQTAKDEIPGFQERLRKVNTVSSFTEMMGKQYVERQRTLENLDYDVEENAFTRNKGKRYLGIFHKQEQEIKTFQQSLQENFEDKDFITPMLSASNDEMEKLNKATKEFSEKLKDAQNDSTDLYSKLKELSVFAIAGMGIKEGFNYIKTDIEIEAKERTSFSLANPISMYNERRQYKIFRQTQEREREYSLTGLLAGGAGGLLISALTGGAAAPLVLGGMVGGSFFGRDIASIKNVEDQSKVQEELKFLNQSYSTLEQYVNSGQSYDISRTKAIARFGQGATGSLNLGYTPDEEISMRSSFADSRGKFDERLYVEQTTFSRAMGIDPEAIYKLNLSARMTGMDVGIGGLDQSRQIARSTYGEGFSNQRVVDVLNDIKNLNEKLLQTNVDMSSRDALRTSIIPSLIFGNNSAWGRLGEKAGDTTQILSRLGKSGSLAEEAWLYQAYGATDPMDFLERQRRGALDPENFEAIIKKIKQDSGGNQRLARYLTEAKLGNDENIPSGFVPRVTDFIMSGKELTKENLDAVLEDMKTKFGTTAEEIRKKAEENTSKTSTLNEEIRKKNLEVADIWRDTIYDASKRMANFWRVMGQDAETHRMIINKLEQGFSYIESITDRIKSDLNLNQKEFKDFLEKDNQRKNKSFLQPTKEQRIKDTGTTGILRHLEETNRMMHSDSYNSWKSRQDSGWWKNTYKGLSDELKKSELGDRYDVNVLEGFDPTGKHHKEDSLHYSGNALDIAVKDKLSGKNLSKVDISKNPELMEIFKNYAAEHGTEYGGNYKVPDYNHFEIESRKKNDQSNLQQTNKDFDYKKFAEAIREGLGDSTKEGGKITIIVEDKTHDGVNVNANSVFGMY